MILFSHQDRKKKILGAILKYLHSALDWDILQLKEIPQDSETLNVLDESLLYWKRKSVQNVCPTLKLPESWNDLLNILSKKMQKNLKYYWQRLGKEFQVNCEDIENKDSLEKNMRVLFELHQKIWTERGFTGAFADSQVKDFYLDITQQFYDLNWLLLRVLKVNMNPVAIHYNFKYNKKIYYYQAGRDPNWSKYGVGDLLQSDIIRSAIQKGYTEFDFTRGAEDYKKRWGAQNKYNFRLELVNGRFLSKVKYGIFRFAKYLIINKP